jgi:hypothetical protein
MLRIVNSDGEELMKLHDDGREEFTDKKLEEAMKKEKPEEK